MRQACTFLACLLWVVAGLVLPASLLLDRQVPDLSTLAVAGTCIALALAISVVRYEFRRGEQHIEVSPDTCFVVLAATVLPPAWAALVGGAAVLAAIRGLPRADRGFVVATGALAAGCGALAATALIGGDPSGRNVLPAAAAAAIVRAVVALVGQTLLTEAANVGGGRKLLLGTPMGVILVLEAGLPVAAICMAGPFLATPPAALLVLLLAQGLTWTVLSLLHQQYRQRQENALLKDTFNRYMPRTVAQGLMPGEDGPGLGGERRDITVLFVDIRGFTSWAETQQPEDMLSELNLLLTDLSEAILSTDGTLDKFTGDGLMAFWGAPGTQPDHATRAIKAVPRMLMRVREFNNRREVQRSMPLEVGIGIASGAAMVGNVGHHERLSYTAIGDTVNLAARLEKATKDAGVPVLVAESTFLQVPHQLQAQLQRLESIEVKGRRERVQAYTPIALAKHRTRADGARARRAHRGNAPGDGPRASDVA